MDDLILALVLLDCFQLHLFCTEEELSKGTVTEVIEPGEALQ